jgi:Kelch motif
MNSTASVELLSSEETLPRSSHSVAVIDDILYIVGGEVSPREPASPLLHVFSLKGFSACGIFADCRWLSQAFGS